MAQNSAASSSSDHQLIQELQQEIQELKARLKAVEARERADAAEQKSATTVAAAEDRQTAMAAMEHSTQPQLRIKGYADVGFFANQGAIAPENHSRFALGQFNLFITSRISPRAGVLTELVVEPGDDNAVSVDLERLLFNYSVSDAFNVSLGRYHSSIGYYNTAYHHSSWMQTTVERPFLFQFEDDGGILPIHNVGMSVNGAVPSGTLGLHYVVEVGNGRASRSRLDEAVQNAIDENSHKSLNLAMFVRPDRWRGLQAGVSYYLDRLTPDPGTLFQNPANPFPGTVAADPRIDERIAGAHVVYQTGRFELLNEGLLIQHNLNGYRTFYTPGFYTQISNRWGQMRPYFRYQYVNANAWEPVFGDVGLRQGPTAGVRFDFTESAAFKIEYDRTNVRGFQPINGMATQVSFAF
ncbi:MAG TPA: hypothetical protein VGF06_13085 [Terriglobales bacterium]